MFLVNITEGFCVLKVSISFKYFDILRLLESANTEIFTKILIRNTSNNML